MTRRKPSSTIVRAFYAIAMLMAMFALTAPTMADETTQPDEEYRALFVTTAYNIDWPSKAGLPATVQQNEINGIILRAQELKCNVIFLQVRSFGDRIYTTHLPNPEPWSPALNFTHDPEYDPLKAWIAAAHAQGIQLYAWVNPFRTDRAITGLKDFQLPGEPRHRYLDVREAAVRKYVLDVIEELLKWPKSGPPTPLSAPNNDTPKSATDDKPGPGGGDDDGIDGIVIDHTFPDPENPGGLRAAAPGAAPFAVPGTKVTAARKSEMDDFIKDVYDLVERYDSKFAISPRRDQFEQKYSNAVYWYQQGWCHYFIPQLDVREAAAFETDVNGWMVQNTNAKRPHLVAGLTPVYLERAKKGETTLWDLADIEHHLDYAQLHKLGQAMYQFNGMKGPISGGPTQNRNLGDKAKTKQYRDGKFVPPGNQAVVALVPPLVTPAVGGWTVKAPQGVEYKWWVSEVESGGNWIEHKKQKAKNNVVISGAHVRICGVDKRNNRSPWVEKP